MGETIRVLVIEPGEKPRLVEMEHTLENLQRAVGGYIQALYPWDDKCCIVCDDDGKGKGYPMNRMLLDEEGVPYDFIAGTFLICGLTDENVGSLPDDLAEKYTQKFYWPEMLVRTLDRRVLWFRMEPGAEPVLIA